MFNMQFNWKEFNVNLEALEVHMKATYPNYSGASAYSVLELHFSEEPSELEKADIVAYWDAMTGDGYYTEEAFKAAVEAAKVSMVSKTWDTMSTGERKIAIGLRPTGAEMGL